MRNEKIGFVGLGMMGLPMARNLVEDGYSVNVFDLNKATVNAAKDFGATSSDSAAETATLSDIVITMVPDSEHVEAVIAGADGILEGLKPGSVVIDMSTIDPEMGKKMANLIEAKGSNFVDAPVTGGVGGAEAGILSILVGGNAEVFERALPVLNVLGGDVSHMGPVGSGHMTKIANQLIGVATLAGMAEAFVLAKKSGLDMQAFFDAVKNGAGRSWALETLGPKILDGDFTPGFMVKHMQKDLRLAGQLAAKTGTALPTSTLIAQLYRSVQADGPDAVNQGHQALVQAIEKMSNEKARK
ncbi:MAG: NAD(P)-dependent oxidoreductase [Chloroflexi bacterium]|jgi:3-hydroxyisobutyrate dehydrogenase|nr:NAD(P)-dependent oxidoreductase [Chloroflexota bacterium]MBT3862188.1 NAD(P)-dependent oxidoreductase [Chloroflexota bacterium]MBT4142903.1 NAD(P)-dependent oxidoreductase [Chloroflexota bacterium]MBT4340790.1 NAD(P)-dependent oxidoreductase [Chloroflexota bacterium]MBT5476589.1 NAD(P)-dependent oxidoreductase [Chloroflexota bacterium]